MVNEFFFSMIDVAGIAAFIIWITKNSQWNEINVQGVISKKFNYQLDIQYRRQSDQVKNGQTFDPNLNNIEKNAYQLVFRPWVHFFPMESRKLRISISPLGWCGLAANEHAQE